MLFSGAISKKTFDHFDIEEKTETKRKQTALKSKYILLKENNSMISIFYYIFAYSTK